MLLKYFLTKTNKLLLILGFFIISAALIAIALSSNTKEVAKYLAPLRHDTELTLPKGSLYVHIASSIREQQTGLSFQKGMKNNEGMLFVFPKEGRYGFWMKDMNFPIDIIWIGEDGTVVYIEEDVATSTYPEVFTNDPKAKYVLELNSGGAKDYGIYLGTKINLQAIDKK